MKDGGVESSVRKIDFVLDGLSSPSIQHLLLNTPVFNHTDMAKLGKPFNRLMFATIVYRTSRTVGSGPAIQEVSAEFLTD